MLKITRYDEVTRFDLARTIAGRGRYWASCYLLDGLLIDSGPAHTAPELLAALEGMPITRIVNTHSHEDHIGANGALQCQRPGLEILAHPLALEVLEDPRAAQPLQAYRKVVWGWPPPSQGAPLSNGDHIQTDRYRLEVIYTPGHSRDHLCLYEAGQGWIFSGDLFVGGQDRALGASYEIWAIIASLKHMAALPAATLFPSSARVRSNPKEALAKKIAYLEDLGERVLALHGQGYSVSQIARRLLGGPMLIELITLGRFSRRHLVRSYLRNRTEA
jgi:glyoxylase-like metal-dependent hydrolase (beta-lactamase superfamily II)